MEPDHARPRTTRRGVFVLRAAIAGIAILLVLGLVPFTARSGVMRAHCRGALLESWPESAGQLGWFNYAPNSGEVFVSDGAKANLCGEEGRRRVLVPLLMGSALAVVLLAKRAVARDAG